MLTFVGSTFAAIVSAIFVSRGSFKGWPWVVLVVMAVNFVSLVTQVLMIIRGHRKAYHTFLWFLRAWLLATALVLTAAVLDWLPWDPKGYAFSFALLLSAHLAARSPSNLTYVTFRERYRVLRQQRAANVGAFLRR
jgi:hypothetical protein